MTCTLFQKQEPVLSTKKPKNLFPNVKAQTTDEIQPL